MQDIDIFEHDLHGEVIKANQKLDKVKQTLQRIKENQLAEERRKIKLMGRGSKLMVDHSNALSRKTSAAFNIITIATHKKAVESMDVSPKRGGDNTFLTTVNLEGP